MNTTERVTRSRARGASTPLAELPSKTPSGRGRRTAVKAGDQATRSALFDVTNADEPVAVASKAPEVSKPETGDVSADSFSFDVPTPAKTGGACSAGDALPGLRAPHPTPAAAPVPAATPAGDAGQLGVAEEAAKKLSFQLPPADTPQQGAGGAAPPAAAVAGTPAVALRLQSLGLDRTPHPGPLLAKFGGPGGAQQGQVKAALRAQVYSSKGLDAESLPTAAAGAAASAAKPDQLHKAQAAAPEPSPTIVDLILASPVETFEESADGGVSAARQARASPIPAPSIAPRAASGGGSGGADGARSERWAMDASPMAPVAGAAPPSGMKLKSAVKVAGPPCEVGGSERMDARSDRWEMEASPLPQPQPQVPGTASKVKSVVVPAATYDARSLTALRKAIKAKQAAAAQAAAEGAAHGIPAAQACSLDSAALGAASDSCDACSEGDDGEVKGPLAPGDDAVAQALADAVGAMRIEEHGHGLLRGVPAAQGRHMRFDEDGTAVDSPSAGRVLLRGVVPPQGSHVRFDQD